MSRGWAGLSWSRYRSSSPSDAASGSHHSGTWGLQHTVIFGHYSTNCDQLTHWLCSTEPNCLHPDEIKHNHILRENRDIWSCLLPFMAMFGYNGLPLFCCDFLHENCDIKQLCALAWFSFNAHAVCQVLPQLCWAVSKHGLSWSFMVFYGRLLFWERSVAILMASNQGRMQLDATVGVRRLQFVL